MVTTSRLVRSLLGFPVLVDLSITCGDSVPVDFARRVCNGFAQLGALSVTSCYHLSFSIAHLANGFG